ncbi:MAG: hypothetical protein COT89_03030 [Candidatus Colwellbacteria bacterium CG10_big_fil_rev_8_21_14_0_10_42_22]|uniref:Uncharacterized protein n=1 Tax=Candidatus Colwellbacteria bacterium CG10_big_fil_rev_8_21_14_0_10_42_22 TaxID=1974540 RepID=A0A2H0VF79_9BACT|nr:MAG: hypothetical protein COT89_03030 [Candidatus Colwellbacteria bacterium CG10_big_fil_rev_8_21_14_0_10_42_22]
MFSLILELLVMISLAIVVYLMAAAVPRLEDKESEDKSSGTSLPLDKLDNFLLKLKDKFLRRVKVLVMKTDNLISEQLKSKKH